MAILDILGGLVIAVLLSLGVTKALEFFRNKIHSNEEKKD